VLCQRFRVSLSVGATSMGATGPSS
jgi:hypothetical protein